MPPTPDANAVGVVLAIGIFLSIVLYLLLHHIPAPDPGPPKGLHLNLSIFIDGILHEGNDMPQARLDQIVTGVLSFVDAFGNSVTENLPSVIDWAVSDSVLADIEVSADGLTARLLPTGVPGTVTVTATAGALTASADIDFGVGAVAGMVLTISVADA